MTERKMKILMGLAAFLIVCSVSAFAMYQYQVREQYRLLDAFCERLQEERPDVEQTMLEIIKEKDVLRESETSGYLKTFGYTPSDL